MKRCSSLIAAIVLLSSAVSAQAASVTLGPTLEVFTAPATTFPISFAIPSFVNDPLTVVADATVSIAAFGDFDAPDEGLIVTVDQGAAPPAFVPPIFAFDALALASGVTFTIPSSILATAVADGILTLGITVSPAVEVSATSPAIFAVVGGFETSVIPEPGSLTLLGLGGLSAVGMVTRRRKQKAVAAPE